MKKLLMISIMLLVGVLSMSGQTYCYKNEYKVSEDGVKVKTGSTTYHYITFTNSKGVCYRSDKNGNADNDIVYRYVGTNNGIIHYRWEHKVGGGPSILPGIIPPPLEFTFSGDFYFSSDYSRINTEPEEDVLTKRKYIWVYERVTAPEEKKAPVQLY